ncbi:serine hydrolase domain-containing protein [Streptomyces sp. NPDC102360]|uniref:serine hydrolase domain-containing protein n=1 Tax=Streptomyces sp. NPDC102360 TaxID=3366160 RepID=UPI00380C5606
MARTARWMAGGTAVAAVGAGTAWLWRHQEEVAFRRPVNEWTFTHMSMVLPVATVPAARQPRPLPVGELPPGFTYEFRGECRTLEELHARTHTTGFAVLHRGRLVHESHPGRFGGPARRFQLFSLTKSVTSILLGIALADGALGSLDDKVVAYCPELAGSAYDGPTVADLLDMTSGAGGVEDYEDPQAPVNRLMRAVTGRGSVLDVVRSVDTGAAPGTFFNYSTLDSQVLGWVLEGATGVPLARYAAERLWNRIGAETDAYYGLTRGRPRTAVGGGSFNATVRDMARVGLLMARGGAVDGQQVVPEEWVERGRGSEVELLRPGALGELYPAHYGYANQWWNLGGERRAFTGLGIYGQFLWVDPVADVVVVKTSAWPVAEDPDRDAETVAALSALVSHLETAE